jgi:RimJ/RimL family protein N-acetyltransferase
MTVAQPIEDRIHIRQLTADHSAPAVEVINIAARWYREFLPPEEPHDPEMDEEQWLAEGRRMTWWGAFLGPSLIGVMGSEPIGEVALLRHAYILPGHQRQGVASALRAHIEARLFGIERVIVGTYAANYKARGILEKGGYTLSADSREVLRTYFDIPEDRLLTSVTFEKNLGH